MRRWVLAAFFLCCWTAVGRVSADELPPGSAAPSVPTGAAPAPSPPAPATTPAPSPAPSAAAIDGAFSTLVMLGDRARQRGQVTEAIDTYRKALALRDDPAVLGKLGLLYALGGAPEMATRNLLVALERGGGTPSDKNEFFKVFKQTRPLVCLLHVLGNVFDAEVSIDGSAFRKEMGPTFKLFVLPGKHVIRGKAPSGDEAVAEQECPKGGEETAVLRWNLTAHTAPPESEPAAPTAAKSADDEEEDAPLPAPLMRPGRLLREKIERDPMSTAVDEEPPTRAPIVGGVVGEQKNSRTRGAIGGGAAVVFGVASWAPAFGVALHASVRPIDVISLDLDARAAWVTSGIGGEPIYAMTAGGLFGLCGHWRWLFGCATGHIGMVSISFDETSYQGRSYTVLVPGFGGRMGAQIGLGRSVALQLSADIVGLSTRVRVVANDANISDQPPVMIGGSLMGVWEF